MASAKTNIKASCRWPFTSPVRLFSLAGCRFSVAFLCHLALT